jgi:hypothetical protein
MAKPEADAETQSDGPMSIARAVEQFTADAKARNLDEADLKNTAGSSTRSLRSLRRAV